MEYQFIVIKQAVRSINLLFLYKEGRLMQNPRKQHKYLTISITPRSSHIPSPTFYRTERNTHQTSFKNLRTQIKDQLQAVASRSPNKNYISDKLQILLRVDNKLEEQIKRKKNLRKIQSKMTILSMQSTKFKISRNKQIETKPVPNHKTSIPSVLHFAQTLPNNFYSPQNRRQANRYPMNSQLESFRSYVKIIALNHPKNKNQRKSEMLSRILLEYFIAADERDVRKDLQEIKGISLELVNCLAEPNHVINLNVLKLIDRDISKLVFNMCYQLYRKKQKGVKNSQLVNINKQIQYSARRLKLYDLVMKTCFDLGKIYCDQMQYQKAFQEYTNAIKLAIFIDSKYDLQIAIDKLGICKYYLGDSVSALYFHDNIHHLSDYDLNRVKAEYSNDNEIKRLIDEKRQFKKSSLKKNASKHRISRKPNISKLDPSLSDKQNPHMTQSIDEKVDVGQFTFFKDNRNQFYPLQNNHQLKNNLKNIIKIPILRQKIHVIKKNLIKNDLIGSKKYCGQNYIIPTASLFCRKKNLLERNEVCLSHRSYNRNDIDQQIADIDNDCKIIITTLNYFINENIINQENVRKVTEQSHFEDSSRFFE